MYILDVEESLPNKTVESFALFFAFLQRCSTSSLLSAIILKSVML